MNDILIVAMVVTCVLAVMPFVPGALELARPRDDQRLEIEQGYVRDPRFFGRSFRHKLAPAIAHAGSALPYRSSIQLHRPERFEVRRDLFVPAGGSIGGVVVALGDADVGRGAKVGDCYATGGVTVTDRATLRALACDGFATLGQDVRIGRWIDAAQDILVGERCDLGQSLSAGGNVRLREHCTFRRLWGRPIETEAPHAAAPITPTIEDVVVFGAKGLSLPRNTVLDQDLVVRGALQIGANSVIRGDIKAHKSIIIQPGVRIEGNVVTRGDLTIAGDVEIMGNIFSERDISIGSRSRIGSADAYKSVYAAGSARLRDRVTVFGWIIAEVGGSVG